MRTPQLPLAPLALLALGVVGCSSPKAPAPEPKAAPETGGTPITATATAPTPEWRGAREVVGSTGAFLVRWVSYPTKIPMNEEFSLRAWVFALETPETPLRDVQLVVDAGMPEHKHGMARAPKLTRRDDGSFVVDGMLFHMPGRWELYFDVVRGELTERAQVRIELE